MDLQIHRGVPDPDEMAALVVVLGALCRAGTAPDPGRSTPRRAWAEPSWAGEHAGSGSWTGLSG